MTQPEETSKLGVQLGTPCEKLQNIILNSEPGASIEFDPYSIHKLHQLSNRNKLADADASTILEFLKEIDHEYTTSACMAENTLQKLHLGPEQLSVDTRKHLKEATQCNQFRYFGQQPIKEMASESQITVEAAEMQESAIKRRIRAVAECDADIKERIALFQRELALAKEEHSTLARETESRDCATSIFNSKAKKQQDMIQQIKEKMERYGIPDEKRYQTVLENYEELKAMKLEMARLQEEICKYSELPPDLEQASRVLRQANQEHDQIMQQISNKIHSGAFSNNVYRY